MTEAPHPRTPFAARKFVPQPDWSAERRRAFLEALLRTGDVTDTAGQVAAAITAKALRRKLGPAQQLCQRVAMGTK